MITDPAGLHRFLDAIQHAPRLALDTEADSLHCYFEKLCLVQAGTEEFSELIDPLGDIDLEALFRALDDKEVLFHGADYDLRMLGRHGEFRPRRIFDTMLAAKLAGEQQVGLAALLEKYFGVQLSKGSQKANWAQRPLSRQMEAYALSDVEHLPNLADILGEKLDATGRMAWLDEWVEKVIHAANNPREKDPDRLWRITGAAKLPPREQAVLRKLWHWRDAEARGWDRPPFHVMSNADLLRISELAVAGKPFSTPRFPPSRRRRFEALLDEALALPESEWPEREVHKRPKPDPNFKRRMDTIRSKRDAVAKELCLDPSLIAPKAAMESLAGSGDRSVLMNWQQELLDIESLSDVLAEAV